MESYDLVSIRSKKILFSVEILVIFHVTGRYRGWGQ